MLSLVSQFDALNVRPGRLFIDGQWLDSLDARFDQLNPCTNEVMTSFAEADPRGVALAVAAARKAFDEGPWPRMRAQDRKRLLQPIVERLYAAEDEIASNMQYMTFRDPVGVVAAILPYNDPTMTFAMKVAPALACGCTVVVKPSELTNLAVSRLAQILAESDLPPGVFNLVTGATETGTALTSHPGVDKVTFTGSPLVGEKITVASAPTMKRLSLELGGKSAALVFPDTRSVPATAQTLTGLCSTFLSGQVCTTPSRAVVHRSIIDEFLHHAREQLARVRFGDPLDAATTSAPMISRRHQARVLEYVECGQRQGATLLAGGRLPGGEFGNGNWVEPAHFANVRNDMKIAQEEIFGPVLAVIPFDTEEEAIGIANDSEYSLAGCVYTTDVSRAFRVARAVKSGSIGVNGHLMIDTRGRAPRRPTCIRRSGTDAWRCAPTAPRPACCWKVAAPWACAIGPAAAARPSARCVQTARSSSRRVR